MKHVYLLPLSGVNICKGYIKDDYYRNKLYKNYGIKLITPFRKICKKTII